MRCHFVYSVPGKGSKIATIPRKMKALLQHTGLSISAIGHRQRINTKRWPRGSPFSNTKHIYEGLSSRIPTLLYDIREQVNIRFEPEDVFIGHPLFPSASDFMGVTERAVNQKPRPRIFSLISPLHCDIDIKTNHINKAYLDAIDRIMPKTDVLFSITGKYWWDRWDFSPYANWKRKMIRLDMAIDTRDFPRVKKQFNPPGKRGYLYIGRNDAMKGPNLLSKLLSEAGDYPRGWIGSGPEIPGVPRISTPRPLTPDFMSRIAEQFDFFITTGIADPNPTTILETMAWGFPVICTPQSGYYETTYRKNVYHDNQHKSVEVLRDLQCTDEHELMRMADDARNVVEREYTWEKFVSTILKNLNS